MTTIIISLLSSVAIIIASMLQYKKLLKVKYNEDCNAVSVLFWLLLTLSTLYTFIHLIDINAYLYIIIAKGIGLGFIVILTIKVISLKVKKQTFTHIIAPILIISMVFYLLLILLKTPVYVEIISTMYLLIAYIYQLYKISNLKSSAGISSKAFLVITLSNVLIVITLVINNVEILTLISQCIATLMAFAMYKVSLIYKPKQEYVNKKVM